MDTNIPSKEDYLEELSALPFEVQNAIGSVDIEGALKNLAKSSKMHFDQWEQLEGEIRAMVLAKKPTSELPEVLRSILPAATEEEIKTMIEELGLKIFLPMRDELERLTSREGAKEEDVDDLEQSRRSMVATANSEASKEQGAPVQPATPPAPAPTEKARRAPVSQNYNAGQPSHERPVIEGDPYREQLQ